MTPKISRLPRSFKQRRVLEFFPACVKPAMPTVVNFVAVRSTQFQQSSIAFNKGRTKASTEST